MAVILLSLLLGKAPLYEEISIFHERVLTLHKKEQKGAIIKHMENCYFLWKEIKLPK